MIVGNNIRFSYDENKEFIKDLNINIEKGKVTRDQYRGNY